MVLLGLGILIASLSFLCYTHPPRSWSFLGWLRKHPLEGGTKQESNAPTPSVKLEEPKPTIEEPKPTIEEPSLPVPIVKEEKTNHELDRKAMPPPPPPFKKPSPKPLSTTTLDPFAGLKTPTVPSFAIGHDGSEKDGEEEEEEYITSFPAANSAQRASGGPRAPPRLNALQPNSGSSLMPPPSKPSPLPNCSLPSSSSSLSLPPTHSSIPAKPRKKVLLAPGHSPLDWARLSSSPTANLRGLPPSTPYLRVPPSLLKTMTGRKGKNAWTVLGGKVYNITTYLPYHPGGEPELLRCAGKDGSRLFGEVHPWVNWEGMLEGCLVGIAVEEGELVGHGGLEEMD